MISLCLHYDCTNRNSFGYCKTTACINPKYNRLSIESTDNTFPTVVIKPITNADRIRAMSDEEIAGTMVTGCPPSDSVREMMMPECTEGGGCFKCWLDWLKQEVEL